MAASFSPEHTKFTRSYNLKRCVLDFGVVTRPEKTKNIDKNITAHTFFAFQTSYILCLSPQSGAVRRIA